MVGKKKILKNTVHDAIVLMYTMRAPCAHLTTCGTGMGGGTMGAELHWVVDMVLFCQFCPPVSFFSPGWFHSMSGLEGQQQKDKTRTCQDFSLEPKHTDGQ